MDKKLRRRLSADELKSMAAKTGIPEEILRVYNSRRPQWEPSPEEQEDDEYMQMDFKQDLARIEPAYSKHNLSNKLNARERKLLLETWMAANTLRFILNIRKHPEVSVRREE